MRRHILSVMGFLSCLVLTFSGCSKPSNVRKLESALGIPLPKNIDQCMVSIDRRPDYNYISLKARFDGDAQTWREICDRLGLGRSETILPYEKIAPGIAQWWDVPAKESQTEKASKTDARGILNALWWNGHIYIEFDGYPPAKP